jgi:enterochelin esterase-like enzyme
VVAGYSLGGLAAACTAVQHPDVFGTVIAQSGSFYRAPDGEEPEWLARHLANSPRLPIHFVMSIGRFETAAIPSRDPSMLTASRHLRDVLRAKSYAVDYRELSSGHEHVAWRAVLSDALRAALGH